MTFFKYLTCLICLIVFTTASADRSNPYFSIEGDWQQGGILQGTLHRPGTVIVSKRKLKIDPDGMFVFGLGRDHGETCQVKYIDQTGKEFLYNYSVEQRKYNVQRIEGVKSKHVTPPKEVTDRIKSEGRKVSQARLLNDERSDFTQKFIWPLSGPITGVYGSQRVYNGVPKSPHYGVDIAAPTGTKVRAPADGIVTLAEDDLYYSGGTLIMDHGHGLSSTFIHLSKLLVENGQKVKQGDFVAEVGASGRATGPHLDWRMNWFKERLDPQLLMQGIPMSDQKN